MSRKIGGFSDAHRRRAARDRAREHETNERDAQRAIFTAADAFQNAEDRAWLARLSETPNILEASKKAALSCIKWLEDHPTRALHPAIRERFRRVEVVLRMIADGRTPDPTKRKPRPNVPPKAPLPAWMNDPSLLPKKPPGRAA